MVYWEGFKRLIGTLKLTCSTIYPFYRSIFTTFYHYLPQHYTSKIPDRGVLYGAFHFFTTKSLFYFTFKSLQSLWPLRDPWLTFWQYQVISLKVINKIPPDNVSQGFLNGISSVPLWGFMYQLLTLSYSQVNNLAMSNKSCTFRLWEGGSYNNKNKTLIKSNSK